MFHFQGKWLPHPCISHHDLKSSNVRKGVGQIETQKQTKRKIEKKKSNHLFSTSISKCKHCMTVSYNLIKLRNTESMKCGELDINGKLEH